MKNNKNRILRSKAIFRTHLEISEFYFGTLKKKEAKNDVQKKEKKFIKKIKKLKKL